MNRPLSVLFERLCQIANQDQLEDIRAERDELESQLASYKDNRSALEDKNAELESQLDDAESKLDDLAAQLPPDPPEVETETVEFEHVESAISDIKGFEDRMYHRQMNAEYKVLSRESFQEVEDHDGTETRQYVYDHFDCVDFAGTFRFNIARRYRINSIGTVITKKGTPHAFNVVVFADGTAELFEPQSGKFVIPESSDLYRLDEALWIV